MMQRQSYGGNNYQIFLLLSELNVISGNKLNRVYLLITFMKEKSYIYIYMNLISVFVLFLAISSVASEPLQLYSASTSLSAGPALTGSLAGGTTIYIKGVGLPTNVNLISVFVGNYACKIAADGLTPTTIACQTSNPNSLQNIYNLPIRVVYNQEISIIEGYVFSYVSATTPYLFDVVPLASTGNKLLNYIGHHRVNNVGDGSRDIGDFIGLYVGTQNCGLFDINQQATTFDGYSNIKCLQAREQEAGKYTVSQHVQSGWSVKQWFMQRASLTKQFYEFAVLPGVSSVTPNMGYLKGQDIVIAGSGFSKDISKMSVNIDGVNCKISASTSTQIKCRVEQKTTSLNAALSTNSASVPQNNYISGTGFRYERYNISGLADKSISSFRTAYKSQSPSITLIQSKLTTELRSIDVYGPEYGQVFKGYFYAPVSGNYIFRGAGDDRFSLLMSTSYGTTNSTLNQIISLSRATYHPDNYYIANISTTTSANVPLQAGKYYYMQAYHVNYAGQGFFKVSVEVPNTNEALIKKRFQVSQIDTKFTNDPEIMEFVLEGANGGTFNLSVYRTDPKTLKIIYTKEVSIKFNANAAQFQNALNQFDSYYSYWMSCTGVQAFDSAGASVALSSSTAVKFKWTVSVGKLRPDSLLNQKFTSKLGSLSVISGYSVKFTETRAKNHGPILSGTFTMQIGGLPIKVYDPVTDGYTNANIPANVTDWALSYALRRVVGFEKIDVARVNDPDYGATWIISYHEYTGNVPDIIVSGGMLTGGAPGTFPSITTFQTRSYSSNIIFNPVDQNFLFTPAQYANVIVTVNNLKSVCQGSCTYSFLPVNPVITSQTLSGSTVSITISNPLNFAFSTDFVQVTVGGKVCTVAPGPSFTSFTCQLPTNANGSPALPAGSYNAEVFLVQGYLDTLAGAAPIDIGLAITSVGPSTGGSNGGYEITLSGNGFPSDSTLATINICGVNAQIVSISSTQAKIIAPPCQNTNLQDITLSFNGKNATTQFTYINPNVVSTIFSVSPQSASPVLKAIMTITGTGFGTNATAVKIYLQNSTGKVYQMRVLSINNTQIKCGIPGGLPGKFDVKVSIDGQGDISPANDTADDFTYQLIVESVSPSTIAYHGGTLLTIKGRNFSPDILENLVHVGNQLNWLCTIETLSRSQITCRTPPTHPDWKSNSQNIVINNRLILDSECPSNNCFITYSDNITSPNLTTISTSSISSGTGTITLSGNNLGAISASSVKVILQNKLTNAKTQVIPTSVTATTVVFNTPSVQGGSYSVKCRLDPVGDTNSLSLQITTFLSVTSLSGSVKGGRIILTGDGLPSQWPSKMFSIKILSNKFYIDTPVVLTSPKKMQITVGQGAANQSYLITLTNPLQHKITATFTQTTAATPIIDILTASPLAVGPQNIQLNRTNLATFNPDNIYLYNVQSPEIETPISNWTYSGSVIQFTNNFLAGRYGVRVYYSKYGNANTAKFINITAPSTYTATPTDSSVFGGQLTVTGNNINPQSVINVGGFKGKIISQTSTQAIFSIPPLVTPLTIASYPELATVSKIIPDAYISDSTGAAYTFDGKHSTFYSSNSSVCYIGVDVGNKKLVNVKRIRYFPYHAWAIVSNYLRGAVFQGSVDGVTYTKLGQVDQAVHAGWNSILSTSTQNYRYIRLAHNTTSNCKLGQLQIYGVLINDVTVSSLTSFGIDAIFNDGFNSFTLTQAITYKSAKSPEINAVSPSTGSIYGNEIVTLTGTNLNIGTPKIFIDGIECLVNNAVTTATSLQCTTQSRLTLPNSNSFVVSLGGNVALARQQFLYVMRWSDIRTWGTDLPPVQGDLVYVPKGMSLYVDQSTPRLDGIVVQDGKLIFADEGPMQIHTNLITVNRGEFRAGTQKKPYQNSLKFIMYGGYYGKQQPMFGNKGIGCMQCKFSMYGQPRIKTWTLLANTLAINSTTFDVIDNVDWKVGEEIVVASTDFDHNQAQQRKITAISGRTVTVDKPFLFKHFSGIQNYGTNKIEMRAEVGLLTRNIVMMGDPTSEQGQYGSHLMLAGSSENGLVGQVAYTQFTHCGQPRIMGRYCIHFHMNGDASDSFAKGNAVHHSFARVITLHAVQYLHVSDNVGYRVKGHNFFIEDGIETQNVIENNLAIGSLQSWNMLQTDISVASFWVTNPLNHLRNNRAAGGDFYGFWYEIKPHPDGPSATMDICPMGLPLGQSHDNVAHSYKRFGLRIFKLSPRQNPCIPTLNYFYSDPWSANPSIQSKFYNYVIYKIGECGLLAEQTGNMIFQNFTIAESKRAGMEFYLTNNTKELVMAKNSLIIGQTLTNTPSNPNDTIKLRTSAGVIGPRSYGWGMSGINFQNFGSQTTILQSCSTCDLDLLQTNTANEYVISNTTFTNVTGNYLFMAGRKRQIIYDLDGTFAARANNIARTSATIVYSFKHLAQQPACTPATNTALWDSAVICDQTVQIRKVKFTNLRDKNVFKTTPMKIQLLSDVDEVVPENSTDFSEIYSIISSGQEPMLDHKFAYSVAFVAGRIYNIWWYTGLDFSHLHIEISQFFNDSDPAIIFKFNYTQNRELFEIGQWVNGQIQNNFTTPTMNASLSPSTCEYGDYTHDVDNQVMTLCATSRARLRPFQFLQVNGIICRYICPSETNEYIMEKFVRLWSNASQWPNQVIPTDGQNVTIPGQWTVLMDMQPALINYWIIKGNVIIPDNMNLHIQVRNVWILSGSLQAGESASKPFPGQLTIQILGQQQDREIVVDPLVSGRKIFVVTGRLKLFGEVPATTWTKLTAFARPGDTNISVLSTAGWKVGDKIVIGPSFNTVEQDQEVTITALTSTNVQFIPALKYKHYGSPTATVTNAIGTLDTRAGVGLLTRNIRIIPGQDSNWGYRMLVYGFIDFNITRTGGIILQGVQLYQGGQPGMEEPTLKIWNSVSEKEVSIYKSSFHYCNSYCLDILNVNNANIRDNVFYRGHVFLVRANQFENYLFENNLMIGVLRRPNFSGRELISCYATYSPLHNLTAVTSSIKHNLCQGSDLYGFVLPYLPCSFLGSPFPYQDNTAGTARFGHTFTKSFKQSCLLGNGAKSYSCVMGHMGHSPDTKTKILQNFMIADSNRGVTLRFGKPKDDDDNTLFFNNSYVSAISRPTCSECYGTGATACSNGRGVRMLAVTINGQTLPSMFGDDFDIICKHQTYDSKAFVDNVIFQNFNLAYGTLPQCGNNSVFEPHKDASDLTGSHNLHNTVCNNCSLSALARFSPPNPKHIGWFGGCGKILCTGKNNYLIQDYTGHFLGTQGFLLSNNSQIGDNTDNCTFVPGMNGHFCQRLDFSVLQYESIAPDYNSRIMWPVYLKYDGGRWNTTTNAWREWQWDGNEPLNRRLGRFASVVQVNQVYNMTFESQPPIDMRLQFQRRYVDGNNSEWIVVKLHHPAPNSIRVQNRGNVIKPISLLDNNGQANLDTSVCGSNKFFYKNYTVHFVITADKNCQVRVSLTNSIQLTARFSMNIDDFFRADGQTKFVDRMCAVLGIEDTSRLKIVGIYNGSVVITAYIDEIRNTTTENATQNDNRERKSEIIELEQKLKQLYANGTIQKALSTGGGLGPLIELNSETFFHIYDPDSEQEQSEQAAATLKALIIGLISGSVSIVAIIVAGVIYIKKRETKISNMSNLITEIKMNDMTQNNSVLGVQFKKQ